LSQIAQQNFGIEPPFSEIFAGGGAHRSRPMAAFPQHRNAVARTQARWTGQDPSDITRASQKRVQEPHLQIIVRDNNIDQALKALKKKMQREGIFREMKLRGHYEKPSEKRARERAEAIRRYRKLQRKRLQREGLLPR
jgi:small subunit ribosomal protein S21